MWSTQVISTHHSLHSLTTVPPPSLACRSPSNLTCNYVFIPFHLFSCHVLYLLILLLWCDCVCARLFYMRCTVLYCTVLTVGSLRHSRPEHQTDQSEGVPGRGHAGKGVHLRQEAHCSRTPSGAGRDHSEGAGRTGGPRGAGAECDQGVLQSGLHHQSAQGVKG